MKFKKWFRALAALLMLSVLPVQAFAAFSPSLLDDPTYSLSQDGFEYREQTVEESGKQTLFYGAYNATASDAQYEWVVHSIREGSDTTLSTVMDIALDYEKQTGRKVMLASNGDFFYATGANVESYVNDGVVISKGSFATKHCIGFDNQGKVTIGRMTEVEKRLMVVLDGKKTFFQINQYNQDPGENGIAVYTTPGTYQIAGAGKYICSTSSSNLGQYPVFGSSRRMTEGTVTNDDAFTLKSGQFAVVVRGENAQFFFDSVRYGVEVDLVEIPAGDFAGCRYVVGGYDILVSDGQIGTSFHTDNFGNVAAPRTLIGFREDGTAFLCMVDGRQAGYSAHGRERGGTRRRARCEVRARTGRRRLHDGHCPDRRYADPAEQTLRRLHAPGVERNPPCRKGGRRRERSRSDADPHTDAHPDTGG